MKLPLERFKQVVRDSVLVSLDLLALNERQEILLGRRKNAPARGSLFVPGGRIYKGEGLQMALARISREEIGVELRLQDATLYGIYHHPHPDNCFGDPEVGTTEYIVIACKFRLDSQVLFQHDGQHEELCFVPIRRVPSHPEIHSLTKYYFCDRAPNALFTAGPSLLSEVRD